MIAEMEAPRPTTRPPAAGGWAPRENPGGRIAWTKRAVEALRQPGNFETEDGKTKRRVRASGDGGRPQALGPADNRKATEGGSLAQPPVRASSGRVGIILNFIALLHTGPFFRA